MSRAPFMPRPLTMDDAASLKGAARHRKLAEADDPVEALLRELLRTRPMKTRQLLNDLEWFAKQAKKRGISL